MSADLLRRAAATMRKEDDPFFDALADLVDLMWESEGVSVAEASTALLTMRATCRVVAESYFTDPGPVPYDAITGGTA